MSDVIARLDARSLGAGESVALGFAGFRPGVGGVRHHLEAIRNRSRHSIRLFPSESATRFAVSNDYRRKLTSKLDAGLLGRFAVVHSHVEPEFIKAAALARKKSRLWIHTYHALYMESPWEGALRPWQVEINRALIADASKADVRLAVSPWLRDHLESRYDITTSVIPNGVDVEKCDAASAERFSRRTGYRDFVVYVSSIAPVKNPKLFVQLASITPDAQFLMIGAGIDSGSVRTLYGKTLPSNLVAIGPLPHEAVLDAIAACRVMVMPSYSEGLPTALMEAMAMGKTVVATDADGCRDVVGDQSCGRLFEAGNLESLKSAFDDALTQPQLGANASRRVRREFSWDVVIPEIDALYELGLKA